ncbi:Subtilisin E precursor [Rubripirellula obstinata]|uniref:Subtilisin E n=1 Tax=Rubripirellula obstinata TaxID=406547 RepID=A0A5B1CM01_9BACT|nr:S8 family serine peptidase [Rubripirellula obstinata]KAA1260819.1 Subtilisin E precursor [Rubripirellula obstinata]
MNNPAKPNRSDIDLSPSAIEPCEERLALSASLAADVLIDLLASDSLASDSLADSIDNQHQSPTSLLDQAAQFRDLTGFDGSGQTVAVIDSGVAWDHVSLGGGNSGNGSGFGPGYRVVGGWDFAENDADPYDDGPAGYHGTHVASLLAGESNLQADLSQNGIVPGADIVALRVFDDAGAGELQWIESALQWVHENQNSFESPITTVNLSVGAALSDANRLFAMNMLEDELGLLREDGILVFAAAGNFFDAAEQDLDEILYPASSPSVVPISSVDPLGELSDFAQRNDGIWAAPGQTIVGSVPDHVFGWDGNVDDFASLSGTSMATPQMAGISMLVRQSMIAEGIEVTPEAILDRMDALASLHNDSVSGLSYRTIDLSDLIADSSIEDQIASDGDSPTIDLPSVLTGYTGTNESESIELDLRDGLQLKVGDQTYSLSQSVADSTIVIDVSGGDDDLEIFGGEGSERLIMYAGDSGTSVLTSGSVTIEFRGFENMRFVGGGGADRATLFDSPGDDTLRSQPTEATLEGVGFRFDVEQVDRIFVHGIHGGNDVAFLHDSAGDDQLSVRPQFSSLKSDETFQLAYGFERVHAFASNDGFDSIEINDSAGDDTLSISAARSVIAGPGYHVSANGFESTVASSTSGGDDVARIYSSAADSGSTFDRWDVQSDRVQWTGEDNSVRIARGFARTEAFEDFQRIELSTQSETLPVWPVDEDKDEAETSRDVFADFGQEF